MSAWGREERQRHLFAGEGDELAVDGDEFALPRQLVLRQPHEGLRRVRSSQRRGGVEGRRWGPRGRGEERRDGVLGEVLAVVDETDGRSPDVGEGERGLAGGVGDGVVVEAEPVGAGGLVRGVEEEVGGGGAGGVVGDQRQHALDGVLHSAALARHGHAGGLSGGLELHGEAGGEEVCVLRPELRRERGTRLRARCRGRARRS